MSAFQAMLHSSHSTTMTTTTTAIHLAVTRPTASHLNASHLNASHLTATPLTATPLTATPLTATHLATTRLSVNLLSRKSYRFSSVTFLPTKLRLIADFAPARSTPMRLCNSTSANRPLTGTYADANTLTACSLPSMFY